MKKREELKASHLSFINAKRKVKKFVIHCLVWGFYSQTPFTNYQNNKTNTITMGANQGDYKKGDNK